MSFLTSVLTVVLAPDNPPTSRVSIDQFFKSIVGTTKGTVCTNTIQFYHHYLISNLLNPSFLLSLPLVDYSRFLHFFHSNIYIHFSYTSCHPFIISCFLSSINLCIISPLLPSIHSSFVAFKHRFLPPFSLLFFLLYLSFVFIFLSCNY